MLLIALIGAIINRIRGGWLTDFARSMDIISSKAVIPFVKPANDLVFALVFSLALGFNIFTFISLFLGMWIGRAAGWGGYISAIVDEKIDHDRDDITLLDKWFRGDKMPVLSGWAALSIRGLLWGFSIWVSLFILHYFQIIELPSKSVFIPFVGLTMGSCYLLTCTICEKLTFRGNGWQYGELLFGAVLWGSVAYLVGI